MSEQHQSLLPPFIPTRASAQVVGGLLFITAAVSWVAVGYDWGEVKLTSSIVAGQSVEPVERLAHQAAGDLVHAGQIAVMLVTGMAFLTWLHRVRVNVRALGVRRLRYGREWTLLGWVVPVLNALRPFQVVREIWQASDPATGDPVAWKNARTPWILWLWWVAFVAYVSLELLSLMVFEFSLGLERIRLAHALGLAADVAAAVSASLAYFLVLRISERQEAKREAWGRGTNPMARLTFDPRDVPA